MSPDTEQLMHRLKALADPVRLRLVALCGVAECSVSELTQVTGLSQPRISQHLKALIAADLLERFRDGQFVYYRVATRGDTAISRRRLLGLLSEDEPQFGRDLERLRVLRGEQVESEADSDSDRSLYRALVELTVARPLGDLLDIGCGQGKILKLLASRAHRSVGVDVDSDQRRHARAELLLAGTPNCSLRQGDMHDLPFDDGEFDTIILDDVLMGARDPAGALAEASRLLDPDGRILLLASTASHPDAEIRETFAKLSADTGLRLAHPRPIPRVNPGWLLAVATPADRADVAA